MGFCVMILGAFVLLFSFYETSRSSDLLKDMNDLKQACLSNEAKWQKISKLAFPEVKP